MPDKTPKYDDGFYHLHTPMEPTPVLVHCYYSSDMKTQVFGFNTHDGGGVMPDIEVKRQQLSKITISLFTKNLIFDYM